MGGETTHREDVADVTLPMTPASPPAALSTPTLPLGWPDDGEPGYVTTSVTGYLINPAAWSNHGGKQPTCYQVCDRTYAYKVVQEFIPGVRQTSSECQRLAQRLCAKFNREDE